MYAALCRSLSHILAQGDCDKYFGKWDSEVSSNMIFNSAVSRFENSYFERQFTLNNLVCVAD